MRDAAQVSVRRPHPVLAALLVAALPAAALEPDRPVGPAQPTSSAERLAKALVDSKDCQTPKVEGAQQFVKCFYTYKGLRFSHSTFRPKGSGATESVLKVEYQEPGMVSAQLVRGKGRCLVVADGPSGVTFGVESGKIQPLVNGRPGADCDSR